MLVVAWWKSRQEENNSNVPRKGKIIPNFAITSPSNRRLDKINRTYHCSYVYFYEIELIDTSSFLVEHRIGGRMTL